MHITKHRDGDVSIRLNSEERSFLSSALGHSELWYLQFADNPPHWARDGRMYKTIELFQEEQRNNSKRAADLRSALENCDWWRSQLTTIEPT